jgi:hypothetical protein
MFWLEPISELLLWDSKCQKSSLTQVGGSRWKNYFCLIFELSVLAVSSSRSSLSTLNVFLPSLLEHILGNIVDEVCGGVSELLHVDDLYPDGGIMVIVQMID